MGKRVLAAFVPQQHAPGMEAEVDFGEVWVVLAGVKTKCHIFAFRLSASGKAVHRVYPTQAQEAFLEGHIAAFETIDGVPSLHIKYDNLTPAVVRVIHGTRDRVENDRWVLFRSHYGFDAFYCEPGMDGVHEKGGVEGEVGRVRRTWLSPMPAVDSLDQLNTILAEWDARDDARRIAGRRSSVGEEFMPTALRSGTGRGDPPQVVALSAVIGDTGGLERWLGGGLLRTDVRPVPLREHVVDSAGTIQTLEPGGDTTVQPGELLPQYFGGSESNKPYVVPLVREHVAAGKKVIVFRTSKGMAVGTAQYLSELLGLPPASQVLADLPAGDQSSASSQLRRFVASGVGFHTADLEPTEGAVLEAALRDPQSDLRVLAATTTLAMGINTPAETVVIVGLNHWPEPYTIAEYKNMAGHAGRPGHAEAGDSYVIATDSPPADVAWNHYVLGTPEDLHSQLLADDTDPRSFVLRSLLVLGASVDEAQLIDLLNNSFAMWQRVESGTASGWDPASVSRDVASLIDARLVDREPSGRLTLTELGRWTAESGLAIQSVVNVASLLRYAGEQISVPDLIMLAQGTTELDDMTLRTQAKSHQEQARWPRVLQQHGVTWTLLQGLHVGGGSSVHRAKRAAACLFLMSRHPFADLEVELLRHTPERSAAGPIRAVAGRTRDVIDTVANICHFYGRELAPDVAIDDLTLQLELGVPPEALPIARQLGAQLTRAEYLELIGSGLADWQAIRDVSVDRIQEQVGPEKADLIKQASESPVND